MRSADTLSRFPDTPCQCRSFAREAIEQALTAIWDIPFVTNDIESAGGYARVVLAADQITTRSDRERAAEILVALDLFLRE
jgi:hypothetical protein